MSIKGSDYRWLKQALERGDLPLVKASAAQLPAVDLPTALDIALLVMDREPHDGERAAVRWLGRWALESHEATLDGLLEAKVAMSALAHEPERWEDCGGSSAREPGSSVESRYARFLRRLSYWARVE